MATDNQLWALVQKYFPKEQWQNAYRVAIAESGGDPRAHNTNGEDSRGLFQINVGPGANTGLAKYNLFDPETNVRLAAQKWGSEGWRPWTTAVQMGLAGSGSGTATGGGEPSDPLAELYPEQPTTDTTPTGPTTGGTPMAGGEVDTGVSNRGKAQQTNPILDNLFAKKGSYSTVVQTNKDQLGTYNEATNTREPPAPTYRYQWDDGTYVDVTADGKVTGTALQGLKSSPTSQKKGIIGSASPGEQWIVVQNPDGSITREPNPIYDPNYLSPADARAATAASRADARQGQSLAIQKYIADMSNQIAQGRLTLDEAQARFNQGLANYTFKNQRQGMAGGLYNQANALVLQGAPFAAPPNRNTFPGFGAGEGAAVASKLLGAKFTPAEFTPIHFDPRGDVERVLQGGYDWPDIASTLGGQGFPMPPVGQPYTGQGFGPPTGSPSQTGVTSLQAPTPLPTPPVPAYAGSRLYSDEMPQANPNLPTPPPDYGSPGQSNFPAPPPSSGLDYNVPIDPVTGQPLLPMPWAQSGYDQRRMR